MSEWSPVVTDLQCRNRAFPTLWESISITRRLNDYSSVEMALNKYDQSVSEILLGQRALKIYQDGDLRIFGQIWEPLTRGSTGIKVVARDPYAGLSWRRNRASKTYTSQDAMAIAVDRVAVQNAIKETFLTTPNLTAPIVRNGVLHDQDELGAMEMEL